MDTENFKVIMSLGTRCYTERFMTINGYRNFSSFFGSTNIKCIDNLIDVLKDDFKDIMDEKNLIRIKLDKCNPRTLYKKFDKKGDFHGATFAHHDLLGNKEKYEHMERCVERLRIIKRKRIKTLFVFCIHQIDDKNINDIVKRKKMLELVKYLNDSDFNFHIIFILFLNRDSEKYKKIEGDDLYSLYLVNNIDNHNTKNSRGTKIFDKIMNDFNIDKEQLLKIDYFEDKTN